MKRTTAAITLFLSFVTAFSVNGANPLTGLVGQSYAGYHDTYRGLVDSLFGTAEGCAELVRLLDEAAAADPTGEWDLNRDLVRLNQQMFDSRDGGYIVSGERSAEDYAREFIDLAERGHKLGFAHIEINALYDAANAYNIFAQNYERAFATFLEVTSRLDTTSTLVFPMRPYMYLAIANFHVGFKEYDEAAGYYRKVTDDPYAPDNYYKSHLAALNGLGTCYRNGFDDYDRADSCFQLILQQTSSSHYERWLWEGIAEGNLAYNEYYRGNTSHALELFRSAAGKITRHNDYDFLSSLYVTIADIYLDRGDIASARPQLRLAADYFELTRIPEKSSDMFRVLSKYCILTGRTADGVAYLDSAIIATNQHNEAYSGLVLRRVEQQLRASDKLLHEHEMATEKARSGYFRRLSAIVTSGLGFITLLLLYIWILYRKKRRAYHHLALRTEEWALSYGAETSDGTPPAAVTKTGTEIETGAANRAATATATDNPALSGMMPQWDVEISPAAGSVVDRVIPSSADRKLVSRLHELMLGERLYRKWDVGLEALAGMLDVKRNTLSKAINSVTGKNFNQFVNEYRIREAVRIISSRRADEIFINELYNEVGFNSRTPFYLAFKQVTGLSPTEYIKNRTA